MQRITIEVEQILATLYTVRQFIAQHQIIWIEVDLEHFNSAAEDKLSKNPQKFPVQCRHKKA